jgi:glycosyltransferase involved in cell wall biosynthesis
MRILIATSSQRIVGGLETYLLMLIPGLLRRQHQVAMLYDYPAGAEDPTVDPPEAELPRWYGADFLRDPDAWTQLAAWSPDIVYSQGLESIEIEKELTERYPTVLFVHTYRGTCISGRKCQTLPQAHPCARTFGPACLALFYPRRCGGLNPFVALRLYSEQMAFKSHFPAYKAVLVASRHMYGELEQHGVDSGKLHLAPLPVAGAEESGQPATKTPRGVLLFAGRLYNVKGAHFLIEAIPKAVQQLGRPLSLVVAGDGPERSRLQDLARRLQVDARFPGWADPVQRLNLMRQADLMVVPSLWPEPFGLVGVEAGCVGLPSVAYAVGGIPDWLIAGESGELAPADPPTVDGLAGAIVRALADAAHYEQLCAGAWRVAKQFTLERHLAQLEAILAAEKPSAECLSPTS